jgi:hypothetical protein
VIAPPKAKPTRHCNLPKSFHFRAIRKPRCEINVPSSLGASAHRKAHRHIASGLVFRRLCLQPLRFDLVTVTARNGDGRESFTLLFFVELSFISANRKVFPRCQRAAHSPDIRCNFQRYIYSKS